MTQIALGRIERVDLRQIWTSEAIDFTPWLALPDNLVLLGDALDLELELEAQEKSVGPFRADILCKDIGTGAWVLIENQLERTDHTHLGQLLTYASGLEAVTVVWIAARFTEEHRSTLDWLNKITDESFRFFGLEVELWRIGSSPVAPKFNIVSKPNNWSRSVAVAARAIEDTELSETRVMQRDYWEAFHLTLEATGGRVSGSRKPQPASWMNYSIGRSRFTLGAVMLRSRRQVRAELYLAGNRAKDFFALLESEKPTIERELGYALNWEPLPEGIECRISICLDNADPEDASDWPRQHQWLAERLNDLHRAFAQRVRVLRLPDAPQHSNG